MKRKELFDKYHIVQISDGRWRAFKDGKTLRYTSLGKLLDVVSVDQTSISSIWDEFIDYKKDFSRPGTIENYNRLYETFIKPSSIYEKPLKKISVHDIKCFFKECNKIQRLKKRYWSEIRGTVSQVFEYAREIDLVTDNPARGVKIPENVFLPETHLSAKKKHFLPEEKEGVKNLALVYAEHNQNPVYYGIILDFQLGLRVGELCALKWSDIEGNEIHIRREVIEDGKMMIDYVKTKSGFRMVPLNKNAQDLLQKIKELNKAKGYPTEKDSLVFYELNSSGVLTNGRPFSFDKALRRLQKKLKFDEIKSMHDIRRTYATELYYAGVGISQIRAWMGHASETQTFDYICYRDDPEDIKKLELIG